MCFFVKKRDRQQVNSLFAGLFVAFYSGAGGFLKPFPSIIIS